MNNRTRTLGLSLVLLAAFSPLRAEQADTSPQQRVQTWRAMSPESRQAMKEQARETAESKASNWKSLSEEERSARKTAMRERMQQARAARATRRNP